MFIIKWVVHYHEDEPVAVETGNEPDIGMVVLLCQNRLLAMMMRHAQNSSGMSHLASGSSSISSSPTKMMRVPPVAIRFNGRLTTSY
jgi:hypothetical protein